MGPERHNKLDSVSKSDALAQTSNIAYGKKNMVSAMRYWLSDMCRSLSRPYNFEDNEYQKAFQDILAPTLP